MKYDSFFHKFGLNILNQEISPGQVRKNIFFEYLANQYCRQITLLKPKTRREITKFYYAAIKFIYSFIFLDTLVTSLSSQLIQFSFDS